MTTGSQSGATVGKPSQPITRVLEHKGATITLTGYEADVAECVRLVLDCPSWCRRDHLYEEREGDTDLHQSVPWDLGDVKTADGEELGVILERDSIKFDGSGGLSVLIYGESRGEFVDLKPDVARKLGAALIEAAEELNPQ